MRGFSTVTLMYCNYYYQHLFSGSRLCLKVSKKEKAYLKASQLRSKTGGKPEVRSPNAHPLTKFLLLDKCFYLIIKSHERSMNSVLLR
jgi:hypothetical protein